MDLNEILFHQQVALIGAQQDCQAGRRESRNLVQHYSQRLARLRSELGVSPYRCAARMTGASA